MSAVLLVMLLFIHSIKLLHKHPVNSFFSHDDCNNAFDLNNSSEKINSSECSICSYQLSKDADDLVYPSFCNYKSEPIGFNIQLISFHKFSCHSAFENRGPPVGI